MKQNFERWLVEQKYASGTVSAQIYRVGRVEEYYGNLDEYSSSDDLENLVSELAYSTQDERENRANPSKIEFEGNIRSNLQSYRDAVKRYIKFLHGEPRMGLDVQTNTDELVKEVFGDAEEKQKFSLERDMQAALRFNIANLASSLEIMDDGAERYVNSGRIDITCKDNSDGAIVVIELKAGKADSRAIGQILGYMGDIKEEEPERPVRGILIAHDFDKRSAAASKVVPTLQIKRYSIEFKFSDID